MPFRVIVALVFSGLLAACGGPGKPLPRDVPPIGDFRLGYNIVVANDVTRAPGSREATEEELTDAVRAAMEERLGRYDGDGLYHIGLRVEGYSLGAAGIPILYSPRSVLLIAMNIWDDATQEKINPDPVRINAFEGDAGPFVGSGLVRGKEEQLEALAFDAALEIEQYLQENEEAWFGPKRGRERVPFTRDPETGRALEVDGEDGAVAESGAPAQPAN
jgi:hypothetical protein